MEIKNLDDLMYILYEIGFRENIKYYGLHLTKDDGTIFLINFSKLLQKCGVFNNIRINENDDIYVFHLENERNELWNYLNEKFPYSIRKIKIDRLLKE